jgi:hypothetical protein
MLIDYYVYRKIVYPSFSDDIEDVFEGGLEGMGEAFVSVGLL